MAMTLLLVVLAALPVLTVLLLGLLFWYYRRLSAWRACQAGGAARGSAGKEA